MCSILAVVHIDGNRVDEEPEVMKHQYEADGESCVEKFMAVNSSVSRTAPLLVQR